MLTVSRGVASPRTREFRAGEPQDASSVGSEGDWQLHGPGVEPIHAYLYFDGEQLYVQSALEAEYVICGGQHVGNDWEPFDVAAVLELGTARLTLAQVSEVSRAATFPENGYLGDEVDLHDATLPVANPAPIVISPHGAAPVSGEERTSFAPLGRPQGFALDDDDEATRFPLVVRAPPLPTHDDDDEATRMVSLEARALTGGHRPQPVPLDVVDDPYDELQERTHASTGLNPGLGTGMSEPAQAPLGQARDRSGRLPEPSAPRLAPIPRTPTGPVPRYGSERDGSGSRARASAELLGTAPRRAAGGARDAETSAVSRSLGEMTRLAPLAPEVEAARKQAIALTTAAREAATNQLAPESAAAPRTRDRNDSTERDTKRRRQQTTRVRGPDGSGGYTPPPPPMALPQSAPVEASKPTSALKSAFDAFATHFEESNRVRKTVYLAAPFIVLTSAYILFAPDPPRPQPPPEAIVEATVEANSSAPTPSFPEAAPSGDREVLGRPDANEIALPNQANTAELDAGLPTSPVKPGKADKNALSNERLAADAYAAGQLDLAIQRYHAVLDDPSTDPSRIPAFVEVLRILEDKRAAAQQERLEQAPPTKSRERTP